MYRTLTIFCVALFLMLGCHSVRAADSSLDDLKAWVDKYPTDKIDGKTVWDNEALKTEVLKFIGPKTQDYIFNVIGRQVAAPVEMQNDVLYVFVCKAHDCSSSSARLFIDLKKKTVQVCWRHLRETEDLWLSLAYEPRRLGAGACTKYEPFTLFDEFGKD